MAAAKIRRGKGQLARDETARLSTTEAVFSIVIRRSGDVVVSRPCVVVVRTFFIPLAFAR